MCKNKSSIGFKVMVLNCIKDPYRSVAVQVPVLYTSYVARPGRSEALACPAASIRVIW